MTTCWLTLWKFCPFHKGHQYLIETALAEVDHLIVIIYDVPHTTAIPLTIRAQRIRKLYPQVDVIEWRAAPESYGTTEAIKREQEAYIIDALWPKAKQITHFYSSEFYGDHVSEALGCENRQVDPERNHIPISGTAIRNHLYENKQFVDPLVYRDMIMNIVFLGAPSTGKTTLCSALSKELNTLWMPEYGREYREKYNHHRRLSPSQLVAIAQGHIAREEQLLLQARDVLITDTNAMTTRIFAHYYHGFALPKLEHLADQCAARYDLVFVCDTDIPYEDTPDRSWAVNRAQFQRQILADLAVRKIPYILLQWTVSQRIATVLAVLATTQKRETGRIYFPMNTKTKQHVFTKGLLSPITKEAETATYQAKSLST